MGFRALDMVKPFKALAPFVDVSAHKRIPLREKMIYTALALFFFLVCSKFPLYGIYMASAGDPLYWMRAIMASSRGTLMELGISPIVTAGMVVQLLTGSEIIHVDNKVKEDRELVKVAQKVLAIFITIGQALAYVASGMYGPVGMTGGLLIVGQLLFTTILLLSIDELLQQGYGFGSGISLFIATNVCENIMWKALSPMTSASRGVIEIEGALVSLGHLLLTRRNKAAAIHEAFFRRSNPNMTNLFATIAVFLTVNFFEGFRLVIPFQRGRSISAPFPIKLLYTSTMPIILQSALLSNFFIISQLLSRKYGSVLVNILGRWESIHGGHFIPVGGLAYYLTAPDSLKALIMNPFHSIFYISVMVVSCALFSSTWIHVSGSSARDVAKQLKQERLTMRGHRDCNVEKELNRHIPIAAALGGMCIGALTIAGDLTGAIGSGTGILLAVTTMHEFFETYQKEARRERGH